MREKEMVSERETSRDWMWMHRLELPEAVWDVCPPAGNLGVGRREWVSIPERWLKPWG